MANGERCIRCNKQETDHELYPDETCETFESEVTHTEDCPVVGCYSSCEATIAARDWRATCLENRLRNAWFLSGPELVRVDIGS